MSLVYVAPLLDVLLGGWSLRLAGGLTYILMAVSFQPMLRYYRLSPVWGLALPVIGAVYGVFYDPIGGANLAGTRRSVEGPWSTRR